MIRKYHNHKLQTKSWHREEEPHNNHETPRGQAKQSKATSPLFPIEMIANLEMDIKYRTTTHRMITESHNGSNNQQRINNNRTTTFERTATKATGGGGGLNAFYWYQILALDSAVVEAQKRCTHSSFMPISVLIFLILNFTLPPPPHTHTHTRARAMIHFGLSISLSLFFKG